MGRGEDRGREQEGRKAVGRHRERSKKDKEGEREHSEAFRDCTLTSNILLFKSHTAITLRTWTRLQRLRALISS